MKLIFLVTAFTASVLVGCSSAKTQSQTPSNASTPVVSSTLSPTPSPMSSIDIERQKALKIVKEMDRIELDLKEKLEKNREEHQKNKLCFLEEYNANFSPNDDVELSPECKKRLADLNKKNSKTLSH